MTQTTKQSLIDSARKVVRETGFCMEWSEDDLRTISLHIAFREALAHAYDMACALLTQLDPAGAAEFIRSTYGPAFRQTGVAK